MDFSIVATTLEKMEQTSSRIELTNRLVQLFNNTPSHVLDKVIYLIQGKVGPDYEGAEMGIAEKMVIRVISNTTGVSVDRIYQIYQKTGDLGRVGRLLATDGLSAVASLKIQLFIPIRPMLAARVSTAQEALDKMNGRAAAEYKIDGERVQIHNGGDKVAIFSRRLENITTYYPDIVDSIKRINSKKIILEAEVVAIQENTGELLPFQELIHRLRKYNLTEAVKKYPVSLNLFDVLYVDRESKTNFHTQNDAGY